MLLFRLCHGNALFIHAVANSDRPEASRLSNREPRTHDITRVVLPSAGTTSLSSPLGPSFHSSPFHATHRVESKSSRIRVESKWSGVEWSVVGSFFRHRKNDRVPFLFLPDRPKRVQRQRRIRTSRSSITESPI